jgi:hypothetical protein
MVLAAIVMVLAAEEQARRAPRFCVRAFNLRSTYVEHRCASVAFALALASVASAMMRQNTTRAPPSLQYATA